MARHVLSRRTMPKYDSNSYLLDEMQVILLH